MRPFFCAFAVFYFFSLLGAEQAYAAALDKNADSSAHDAQTLRTFDWVLLEAYDAEGEDQSNLQAAGYGSPKFSFSSEGSLVVDQGCTSIGGDYQITKRNQLSYKGYSIAGSICMVEQRWQTDRLAKSLSQLSNFQITPNKNKFKARLLLHFKDGSHWVLAPTNKLLIVN